MRQLNNIMINMKLRDNMLYQTASPTLLNFYDQFSSVVFVANSTPINRDDVPITKHISDFINNMKPAQRTTSTTQATEWYICLTEEEHQHYQQYQQLMTRPFSHHQQQRPRLHSDSVSAINYLIYVASTATATSESILPNVPNDATLYLYSFILVTTSSSSWVRYNRRAGFQELEPSTGATVSPTNEWGYNNIVVAGGSSATLSFIRDSAFQQQHVVDYNLISSPTQCHVASDDRHDPTSSHQESHQRMAQPVPSWHLQRVLRQQRQRSQQMASAGYNISRQHLEPTRINDGSSNIWASG